MISLQCIAAGGVLEVKTQQSLLEKEDVNCRKCQHIQSFPYRVLKVSSIGRKSCDKVPKVRYFTWSLS